MEAVQLDTNVFSYLMKPNDDRADLYKRHVEHKRIALSFITVGELYAWAITKKWRADKIAAFEARLRQVVIIPYDVEVCKAYARLATLKTPEGSVRNVPSNDRWIAACAIRHGLALITHNRADFVGIPDLTIITEAPTPRAPAAGNLPLDIAAT